MIIKIVRFVSAAMLEENCVFASLREVSRLFQIAGTANFSGDGVSIVRWMAVGN
jgi:hypothetical protein